MHNPEHPRGRDARSTHDEGHEAHPSLSPRDAEREAAASRHGQGHTQQGAHGHQDPGRHATPAHGHDPLLHGFFRKFAHKTSTSMGSPWAFVLALAVILTWGITGPIFHFSDTWQLVINTGTTIVTFLMVFLIQNTQNRDAIALHIKIDELIRAVKGARNRLIDLDELSDEELEALHAEFRKLGAGTPSIHPYPTKKKR